MAGQTGSGEFQHLLRCAHQLADIAGPVVLQHFRKSIDVENKAGAGYFDPVTKADRGAERAIAKALRQTYPDHSLIGEEFGTKPGKSPYQWVVDPIDGTRAYIMGSPMWGTLIGLLRDGKPVLGVMDQPFTGEIGRASCRESVEISVVAVSLKINVFHGRRNMFCEVCILYAWTYPLCIRSVC